MQTMMITVYNTTELEALSDEALITYKAQLIDVARRVSTWEVETEQWMRECPQRLAERAEATARAEAESAARIAAAMAAIDAQIDAAAEIEAELEYGRLVMQAWPVAVDA